MNRPASRQYAFLDGVEYRPDPVFVKRLKALDPKLEARWMPRFQRWGIFRQSRHLSDPFMLDGMWLRIVEDLPVQIYTCETDKGGFRQLGSWDLKHLREIDLWRLRNAANDLLRRLDASNDRRRKSEEAYMDDLNKEGVNTLWNRIHEKKTVDIGAKL